MTLTSGGSFSDKVRFIWSIADLLRGDYKPSEYGKVMLPLVVLRRLDCGLGDAKAAVITKAVQLVATQSRTERDLKSKKNINQRTTMRRSSRPNAGARLCYAIRRRQ